MINFRRFDIPVKRSVWARSSICSSAAFQQGELQVRLVEWDKAMVHASWCVKGHVGYVLEGVVEIDIAGEVVRYEAGDVLILPEGEAHKHRPKVLSEKMRFFSVEKVS